MAVTKVSIQAALSGALDLPPPMYAAAAAAAFARASDPAEDAALLLAHRTAAGQQLGIKATDEKLMLLVDDMLKVESMPPRWTAIFDSVSKPACWVYKNDQGVLQYEHPLIDYYRGAVFMDMGGYRLVKKKMRVYSPLPQEVQSMLAYFGITEDEHNHIKEVAKLAIASPMPTGWEEQKDPVTGEVVYKDTCGSLVLREHPLDSYFRELRDRRRRDIEGLRWAAVRTSPVRTSPSTPVPTAKSSPPPPPVDFGAAEAAPSWRASMRLLLKGRSSRVVSSPGAAPSRAMSGRGAQEPLRRAARGSISCSSIESTPVLPSRLRACRWSVEGEGEAGDRV